MLPDVPSMLPSVDESSRVGDSAKRLLRNRKFLGFVGQDVAARASSSVANVCVVWLVFTSTHSAIDVGIVAIAESIATLAASLPAGTLVDRFSRRALLFISHTIQGLTFALLVFLLTLQGFHLNLLIAFVRSEERRVGK